MKPTRVILPILLIVVVIAIAFILSAPGSPCSSDNPAGCDKSCSSDEDCKWVCPIGCISYSQPYDQSGAECETPPPCYDSCRCVSGKCTTWGDIVEEALVKQNTSICDLAPHEDCQTYCRSLVEAKSNKTEMSMATDLALYEQAQDIIVTIKNTGDNNITFYPGFVRFAPVDDPSWEQIFSMHYQEFLEGCAKTHSSDCTLLTLERGEEYTVTMPQTQTPGNYTLITMMNNQTTSLSNEFSIKPETVVTTVSSKKTYELGEIVEITVDASGSIYSHSDAGSWSISRLDEESWTVIKAECDVYGGKWVCENGTLDMVFTPPPPAPIPPSHYQEYQTPTTHTWKQTICGFEEKLCGNQNYTQDILQEAEPGIFKAKFCYWDESGVEGLESHPRDQDWLNGSADFEKMKCVEKEFEVVEEIDKYAQSETYCEQNNDCIHQGACCHACGSKCVNTQHLVLANCTEPFDCTMEVVQATDCKCINSTCTGILANGTC